MADLLRAGPGPDPALHRVPAAGRQDPGVRLPRGPPADPADPRARGGPGGDERRPGLPAQRGADRGHRPRPRLRARPGRPRQRGRARPLPAGGFDHAPWGADVSLASLNLCAETLDGIRNHSWSRPAPVHPRGRGGELGRPHRLRLPRLGGRGPGRHRRPVRSAGRSSGSAAGTGAAASSGAFIDAMVDTVLSTGRIGMDRADGRGPGRLPGLQLRAHLPARGLGGPGRGGRRGAAGAGRALRRPTERHPRRPGDAAGCRPASPTRCGPRSPTSRA